MKRTRCAYPAFYKPIGGHMSYPPRDCTYADKIKYCQYDIPWIDLALCSAQNSKCTKKCERFGLYKAEREAELTRLGFTDTKEKEDY